jgi:hypothetical protein
MKSAFCFIILAIGLAFAGGAPYPVVGTGQSKCYDNRNEIPPPQQGNESGPYRYVDVHGAGSQRSDPKSGDPAMFPHGRGPQGDVIRINNFVRVARNTSVPMKTAMTPLRFVETIPWHGHLAHVLLDCYAWAGCPCHGCRPPQKSASNGFRAEKPSPLAAIFSILFLAGLPLAAKPPNFVVVLGEGHGWSSTSVQMDDAVPASKGAAASTPNLETLANGGMRFADFYAASPRCTPTRAAIFTGKSPAALHVTFVGEGRADNRGAATMASPPGRPSPASATSRTPSFAQNRPGWPAPIHDLLKNIHVSIVFHGHDHLYAKQDLDGIVYQEVPQPGCPGDGRIPRSAAEYGYAAGTVLGSSGHMRVAVSPENVKADYVRSILPKDEAGPLKNGAVADRYELAAPRQ